MGITKDIWDIIRSEPEVRKWLKQTATSSWKILKSDKPGPRRQGRAEAIEQARILLHDLTQDDFPERFNSTLTYLGTLLAQVGNVVELKERGVLLSNLYTNGWTLYFPVAAAPLRHVRRTVPNVGDIACLVEARKDDNTLYTFWGIDRDRYNLDFQQTSDVLDRTVRTRGATPELEAFRAALGDGPEFVKFYAIGETPEARTLQFMAANNDQHLPFSWADPHATRRAFSKDLTHALDFRLA